MRLGLLAAGLALALTSAADAAPVDAVTMLRNFSVIALGDHTLQSHTPGPVYAGGTFTASGQSINGYPSGLNPTVGGASAALVVGGTVAPSTNITVNGNVALAGTRNGARFTVNGGSVAEGADVPVAEVAAAFKGLSSQLAGLGETGGETFTGDRNNPRLNVGAAGAGGFAVVNLSGSELDFFFGGNAGLNFLGGTPITTVLNIDAATFAPGSGRNFNGFSGSNNVILNFYNAISVRFDATIGLSILAPFAHVEVNSGGADTFVVGGSLFQKAEIRKPFTGVLPPPPPEIAPVPLPASIALLGAALGGLGLAGRRRSVRAPTERPQQDQ